MKKFTYCELFIRFCVYVGIVYLFLKWLMPCVEDFVPSQDPLLDEIMAELVQIDPRLDGVSLHKGDKTYTLDKKKIYMCTKNGEGEPYRDRTSLYSILGHECAHVLCKSIGHTPEFYTIFNDLKQKMAARGLIRDPNEDIKPNYCGYN